MKEKCQNRFSGFFLEQVNRVLVHADRGQARDNKEPIDTLTMAVGDVLSETITLKTITIY